MILDKALHFFQSYDNHRRHTDDIREKLQRLLDDLREKCPMTNISLQSMFFDINSIDTSTISAQCKPKVFFAIGYSNRLKKHIDRSDESSNDLLRRRNTSLARSARDKSDTNVSPDDRRDKRIQFVLRSSFDVTQLHR